MYSGLLHIKKFTNLLKDFTDKLSDAKELAQEVSENFSKKAGKTIIRHFGNIEEEVREAQDDLDAAQDTLDDIKDAGFSSSKFARHFAELQDMFKELVSEVSDAKNTAEAATVSEADADVDVKESVNNFSKVVESGTKKVLKLFSDVEDKIDTLADDTEAIIDKVEESATAESKDEDKSVEETTEQGFSKRGRVMKFRRCSFSENTDSVEDVVSDSTEEVTPENENIEALAEGLEEAVDNFCQVADKEALSESEKKELVGAFSDLGRGLDAITGVIDQENLEKLAKIVNYTKNVLAKFCGRNCKSFSASSKMKLNHIMRFFSEELPAQVDAIVDESPEAIEAAEQINVENDELPPPVKSFCGRRFARKSRRFADEAENVCPDCGNSPCTCEELANEVSEKVEDAADEIEDTVPTELAQFARKLLRKVRRMHCHNFSEAQEKVEALEDAKEEIDSKVAECKDGKCDDTKETAEETTAEDEVVNNFGEVVDDVVLPPEEKKALTAQFAEVGKALENVDDADGNIAEVVEVAKEKIDSFCDKLDALNADNSKVDEIKKYFAKVKKELDKAVDEKKEDDKDEKKEEATDKSEDDAPDAEKVADEVADKDEDNKTEDKTEDKDDVKDDHVESFSEEEVLVGEDMIKDDIVTEVQNEMNAEGVEIKKPVNNFSKNGTNKSDTYGAWLSNML